MSSIARHLPDKRRSKSMLRIPESHALYVCPNSCGRRQGIRGIMNGVEEHASFLTLSQTDVALGDYVDRIEDAAACVVERVRPRPRVLTLYVNCIDDFLGTDVEALVDVLSARFPDVRFLVSRINPVSTDVAGEVAAVARGVQANLYAPLTPGGVRDAGVNIVGSFVAVPDDGELSESIVAAGAGPVRQLPACRTFDEYARMADSCLTVSLSHVGDAAAADMEARLGIPWMRWHACYCVDETERRHVRLARLLNAPAWSCETPAAAARAAVERARMALGELPVVVDTSATFMPFSLALALLEYGFNVQAVFALHSKGCDDKAERRLGRQYPDVRVFREPDCRVTGAFGVTNRCVAIGRDAEKLLDARWAIEMYHDEGYLGSRESSG